MSTTTTTKAIVFLMVIFMVLCFSFCSCRSQNSEKYNFHRDIYDYKNGKSRNLTGLSRSRDALSLDTLENGFDSIEMRIWVTYSRIDTFQIVSIKKASNSWIGSYCQSTLHFNEDHDSILSYTKTQMPVTPKLGWPDLIDSLFRLNILTLPDCRKIQGYDFPLDGGNTVLFEVATQEKYRFYMYQLPSTYKAKFKEAANIDNILRLLSDQFSIRYLATF